MLDTAAFGSKLNERGFSFYSGVPCSFLKSLINYALNQCEYVAAANEGDAVAIAIGAYLGGRKSVVLMQNSGLTNATSPLISLNSVFRLPTLGFVSLRGEPGIKDEPQHELIGAITTTILDTMQIEWEFLSPNMEEAERQLERADHCIEGQRTFFFVVRKDTFSHVELKPRVTRASSEQRIVARPKVSTTFPSRREILKLLVASRTQETVLLSTTGYTSRELNEIADAEHNFYMVGSMGCVSSMGLGLALAQSRRPIVVVDGDGALLMRLGALATNGFYRPKNMLHILLDNGCHESTGAQFTVSSNVDWARVAAASGYACVCEVDNLHDLSHHIQTWQIDQKLTFVVIRTRIEIPDGLSRPSLTPPDVAARFMRFLGTAR